jgi:hypothetical protein
LHQAAPLIELAAAPICTLDRSANDMRQGHFDDLEPPSGPTNFMPTLARWHTA